MVSGALWGRCPRPQLRPFSSPSPGSDSSPRWYRVRERAGEQDTVESDSPCGSCTLKVGTVRPAQHRAFHDIAPLNQRCRGQMRGAGPQRLCLGGRGRGEWMRWAEYNAASSPYQRPDTAPRAPASGVIRHQRRVAAATACAGRPDRAQQRRGPAPGTAWRSSRPRPLRPRRGLRTQRTAWMTLIEARPGRWGTQKARWRTRSGGAAPWPSQPPPQTAYTAGHRLTWASQAIVWPHAPAKGPEHPFAGGPAARRPAPALDGRGGVASAPSAPGPRSFRPLAPLPFLRSSQPGIRPRRPQRMIGEAGQ
jgi:hypothetical protein